MASTRRTTTRSANDNSGVGGDSGRRGGSSRPDGPTIGIRDASQEVDSLMCSLHRVATSIHEDIESTRRGPSARASHIVDFSQFESRARQIAVLRTLHSELQNLTATVAQYGLAAETLHQDEIQAMQEYIASADSLRHPQRSSSGTAPKEQRQRRRPDDDRRHASDAREPRSDNQEEDVRGVPWKDKALTARLLGVGGPPVAAPAPARLPSAGGSVWNTAALTQRRAEAPSPPALGPPIPQPSTPSGFSRRKIVLADQVSLDAVIIPDTLRDPREILAAVNTPELYYIPRWDHFAVRIGAVVFHGNIGQVYPTDSGRVQKAPERVKECRLRGDCPSLRGGARCTYYHDPADCGASDSEGRRRPASSRDIRNFIADSWLYAPATSRYSARYGSRRIGSREALTSDLREISAADARRHLAQTAHDILCSIILAKYVLSS